MKCFLDDRDHVQAEAVGGSKTLSMKWMTPLVAMTSALTTLLSLILIVCTRVSYY